jgi:hypothetical protein
MVQNSKQIVIFSLLFLAWLPLLAVLWPYPTHGVAEKYHAAFQPLIEKASTAVEEAKTEKGIELKEAKEAVESFPTVEELQGQLQYSWAIRLFLFIFGVFSVIYAFKQFKGWKVILATASVAYLLLGYSLEWSRLFQSHYWLGLWQLATESEIWSIGAMYREFIFPVFHVFLIAVILLSLFMNKSGLTSHPSGR